MLGRLYAALRAAEEVAGFDNQLNRIRTDIVAVREKFALLRWMIGFNTIMIVAIGGRVLLAGH